MDEQKPHRRWFRFSLRTLLAFTLLVSAVMGWVVRERDLSQSEQGFGKLLEDQGWVVGFSGAWDSPELRHQGKPQGWWRKQAQKILGRRISLVCFNGHVADLSQFANLTHLNTLRCSDRKINDLSPLATLTELRYLYLAHTDTSDLAPLAGMTNLSQLNLEHTKVSDLSPLASLTKLESLSVGRTLVNNLEPLAGLKELKDLNIRGTQVLSAQIEALKKALPNCEITQ